MPDMPAARLAVSSDLASLLALFTASEVSSAAEPREHAERVWAETMTHPNVHVFVTDERDCIAATCMLVTAPNLLRDGRRHGFLENVVTHPDFRGRGHGRAVVQAALAQAWASNCHHVLMQSGRGDPRVHAFYEGLGFVPGLRVAYVAKRPPSSAE
jgi:GNAT superfamily N-acetyltransferase